jgi:hypothetical protein
VVNGKRQCQSVHEIVNRLYAQLLTQLYTLLRTDRKRLDRLRSRLDLTSEQHGDEQLFFGHFPRRIVELFCRWLDPIGTQLRFGCRRIVGFDILVPSFVGVFDNLQPHSRFLSPKEKIAVTQYAEFEDVQWPA